MARSSISTMWAIGRFERAADFVARVRDIGFDEIELNHQVSESMLQEYRALQKDGSVKVSSVHAPCPKWQPALPAPPPELSALDETSRIAAIGLIKRTIDTAVDLRARAVVVHCGRVEIDLELERTLRQLHAKGQTASEEYRQARASLMAARDAARRAHVQATLASLAEVAGYAAARNIWLGLENRYHYYEIPLPNEVRLFLDSLDNSTVFYWHDVGHAHNLAALDLVSPEDWLPGLRDDLRGMHLHDAIGLDDHRVAGAGEVDFAALRRQVPPRALLICEFDESSSEEDVKLGYNYLKQMGYF